MVSALLMLRAMSRRTPSPNAELLQAAQAGDRRALERLLRSLVPAVRRLCARMASSSDDERDIDEVVQDTLMALCTSIGSFRGESSLLTWTYTLARTQWNRRRRRKTHGWHQRLLATELTSVTHALVDPGSAPEEHVASGELRTRVDAAISRLPDLDRDVLLLRDLQGYSAPEVAELTGLTVPAVKTRLHRARARVRSHLQEHLDSTLPLAA